MSTEEDLKTLTEKHERMRIDLRDALTEIENRGMQIAGLEGLVRDFALLLDEALFPRIDGSQTSPEDRMKKAKVALLFARRLDLF